jgi:TonB family protein
MEAELPTARSMKCLWPRSKATSSKALTAAAWSIGFSCLLALYPVASRSALVPYRSPATGPEKALRHVPAHISEFAPVSEPLALPKCGTVSPPEALLTPDPLLPVQNKDMKVRVSFIVGTDGYVHSPFIVDSGGPDEDQVVLRAVRSWRYRPALCNGVPTDYEALVRFSIR